MAPRAEGVACAEMCKFQVIIGYGKSLHLGPHMAGPKVSFIVSDRETLRGDLGGGNSSVWMLTCSVTLSEYPSFPLVNHHGIAYSHLLL